MCLRAVLLLRCDASANNSSVASLVLAGHDLLRSNASFVGTRQIGQGYPLRAPRIPEIRALMYVSVHVVRSELITTHISS
jgi:hypothetical protein